MDNQEIIIVEHVSMRFNLASDKVNIFKEYLIYNSISILRFDLLYW